MDRYRDERAGLYRPAVPVRIPRSVPDAEFSEVFARLPCHRDRALMASYVSTRRGPLSCCRRCRAGSSRAAGDRGDAQGVAAGTGAAGFDGRARVAAALPGGDGGPEGAGVVDAAPPRPPAGLRVELGPASWCRGPGPHAGSSWRTIAHLRRRPVPRRRSARCRPVLAGPAGRSPPPSRRVPPEPARTGCWGGRWPGPGLAWMPPYSVVSPAPVTSLSPSTTVQFAPPQLRIVKTIALNGGARINIPRARCATGAQPASTRDRLRHGEADGHNG